MIRQPVVAGQFYPGSKSSLEAMVAEFLAQAGPKSQGRTILAMAPHAGYVYSGAVAGLTLGAANLAPRVLLLGPNHTGRGKPLAVWDTGSWLIPGGEVPVDETLAAVLLAADARLAADQGAHLGEHSLEVLLPFLARTVPGLSVVPVAVAEARLEVLMSVAEKIAGAVEAFGEPVSIAVSSDMSHYVSGQRAKELDALALDRVAALDPEGLFKVVRARGITMCGVLPMTLGLAVAKRLGATRCEIAAYATSGDVTGDYAQVVGYAGALVA